MSHKHLIKNRSDELNVNRHALLRRILNPLRLPIDSLPSMALALRVMLRMFKFVSDKFVASLDDHGS